MHHVNFNSLQLTKQTILLGNNDKNDNKPLLFGRRSFEIITVACAFKRHFLTEQDQTSPVICHSIGLIGVFRRSREFKRSRFFFVIDNLLADFVLLNNKMSQITFFMN